MTVFLETDRLILRRFTFDDVDELVRLDADPAVMRFLAATPTPREEIEDRVLPSILRDYQVSSMGRFAAIERSSAQFIGWLALTASGDHTTELGYRLVASAWGNGYATEGAQALIHKAFTELGVERVWAQTMAVNAGSRRVMEKAGLTHLRTFHEHFDNPLPGTEHGEVEYELLRANWIRDSEPRFPGPISHNRKD